MRAELNYEDRPHPTHAMFDAEAFAQDRRNPTSTFAPLPIMDVFERYAAEQQPAPKTVKKWRAALCSLIGHVGHDDMRRVTSDSIVSWKDALLTPDNEGQKVRGQATVRNGYLGAVKPVFQSALNNRLISTNPVTGVTVNVPRRIKRRTERGYTDNEAIIVLTAAFNVPWATENTYTSFACRWLPWLCAYTGARIGELAQLRRTDIAQTADGIWFLTITPEAGSQKGGYARQVALHPHLIEQGFIEAIESREGPLFYDPKKRRIGSQGNPQYVKVGERVAKWVRSLGLSDEDLQPNHGWRHRFTTIARAIRMDVDVRQSILGHAAQNEHQEYGDVLIRTSHEWLSIFPRCAIKE